jgi:hypothetical protein
MYQHHKFEPDTKSPPNWLMIVLAIAFVIAAGATAILTFMAVRDFIISRGITGVPGINVDASQGDTADASGPFGIADNVPLQSENGPTPEPWDGSSRRT